MDEVERKRIDQELQIFNERSRYFWSWFKGERSYARLHRDCRVFWVDLRHLEETGGMGSQPWLSAAYRDLANAAAFLKKRDVEGGWTCLHAAQRYAIYGLSPQQLQNRATLLRGERDKLSEWRSKAVEDLLHDAQLLTADRMIEATRLRDEHDANQYHKIWLTADQLGILTISSAIGLLFLLPLVCYHHYQQFEHSSTGMMQPPPSPWGYSMVAAVLVLGMFGGAFSVAQSIITDTSGAKIPERVANHWVTFIRALFGSVAGLAGYSFYRSKIINITIGNDGDTVAVALAVAFLFGYAGERLIAKVADSVGVASQSRPSKR
jgi:hypothetical protein